MSRVIVRAPNWLGDILMALPSLVAIRRHFGGDTIVLAAPAAFAPLAAVLPGVDEVVPLDRSGSTWRRIRREANALAAARAVAGILLTNSFGSALALRLSGTPERWGFRAGLRGPLLTRGVARPVRARGEVIHQARYYRALVQGLGIAPGPEHVLLAVPPDDVGRGRALLERHGVPPGAPVVGLAPGAAYGHAKRWPPDRVAALVTRLTRAGAACVLVGNAGDQDAGAAIESALAADPTAGAGRLVNLIGRTDMRQLMGVMAACQAFVSNDSGAMHLAAAVGVPVTAVFGPTDERATAPLGRHHVLAHDVWCRPCHLRDCPIDHRCMKGITPDMVFDSVAADLAPPGAGAP